MWAQYIKNLIMLISLYIKSVKICKVMYEVNAML